MGVAIGEIASHAASARSIDAASAANGISAIARRKVKALTPHIFVMSMSTFCSIPSTKQSNTDRGGHSRPSNLLDGGFFNPIRSGAAFPSRITSGYSSPSNRLDGGFFPANPTRYLRHARVRIVASIKPIRRWGFHLILSGAAFPSRITFGYSSPSNRLDGGFFQIVSHALGMK